MTEIMDELRKGIALTVADCTRANGMYMDFLREYNRRIVAENRDRKFEDKQLDLTLGMGLTKLLGKEQKFREMAKEFRESKPGLLLATDLEGIYTQLGKALSERGWNDMHEKDSLAGIVGSINKDSSKLDDRYIPS